MATLYKHGEIGQIERLCSKYAYCLDGKILRNSGSGWKIYAKVKEGIDPRAHFETAKANYARKLAENPAFAHLREILHETVSFGNRHVVKETISLMSDDADGVWSTFADNAWRGVELDLDDCVALCDAFRAMEAEFKAKKAEKEEMAKIA